VKHPVETGHLNKLRFIGLVQNGSKGHRAGLPHICLEKPMVSGEDVPNKTNPLIDPISAKTPSCHWTSQSGNWPSLHDSPRRLCLAKRSWRRIKIMTLWKLNIAIANPHVYPFFLPD